MRVILDRSELLKILEEKFGKQNFVLAYIESDLSYEARNNVKISELKEVPDKSFYMLNIN